MMLFSTTLLFAVSACTLRIASAATVMAHFMVQNSYAYNMDQWRADIKAAKQVGIDGFALNWMPPDCTYGLAWQADRIDDAYLAAEEMGFKLMHSFDMSWSECDVYWNQTYMADMVMRSAGSSATYRWNSNILVSTYGGDTVEQYGNEFFHGLKSLLRDSGNPISFAPALTSYSHHAQESPQDASYELLNEYPTLDGYMNWQAWPLDNEQNTTCTADQAFQGALKDAGKTGPYIMAISPWQYKDLNNGNPMDAWVAYSDYLLPQRLSDLATNAIRPDIIELLTWNDFCESHYLRDLPGEAETDTDYVTMGDMAGYVNGMNHAPWRIIAKYYIEWWKTGAPPVITMDQVVFWYRIHPKDTQCASGMSAGPIRNAEMPADAVFAWALVREEARINVSVGGNSVSFSADGNGPQMAMVEFPADVPYAGVRPRASISRDGGVVHEGEGSVAVSTSCDRANFNPVVNLVGEGINQ